MTRKYTEDSGLAFLTSQLNYLETKIYEVKYDFINYTNVVDVSNEAGSGATSITYFSLDGRGQAKFIGSNAMDVPIVEVATGKTIIPVELGAVGFQYTLEELRQADMLAIPLSTHKANLARRAYESLAQRVCMTGDTQYNLPGFINNSEVSFANVVDPGGGTEWINKTPRQILVDINTLFAGIMTDSLQNEKGNMLAIPTFQWGYIAGTTMSDLNDKTILEWLVSNSPYLDGINSVIALNELDGAGAAATDRMVAYTKDPDKVIFHIPMPLTFHPPQMRELGFKVPGEFKLSGVNFRYPGSARYADGI